MSETPRDQDLTDADWALLRAAAPQPAPDLMARIAADAARLQPVPKPGLAARLQTGWAGFVEALGGWQGASALTASALLGLWMGMADDGLMGEMSAQLLGGGFGTGAESAPDDPLTAFLVEG